MPTLKIVAILDRSAGNETVGEMWKETKIFAIDEPISNIFFWANKLKGTGKSIEHFTGNLTITIAQE